MNDQMEGKRPSLANHQVRPVGRWRFYLLCAVVNACLGYVAIAPLLFLGVVLDNEVLFPLGWSDGNSIFDEGSALVLLMVSIILVPLTLIFIGFNFLTWWRSGAPGLWYWLVAMVALLLPFTVSALFNALWDLTPWSPYDLMMS